MPNLVSDRFAKRSMAILIFSDDEEPNISSKESLKEGIKLLRIPEVSKFEMDNMNEDGICSMRKFYSLPISEIDEGDGVTTAPIELKVSSLVSRFER